ncbi:MAG TPA: prolyl oligopeptidase family serine peptidase [Kofleriaceae bacterium]
MRSMYVACVVATATLARADTPVPNPFDPFAFPHASPTYNGLGAGSVSAAEVAKYAPEPLPSSVTRHIQAMLDIRGAPIGQLESTGMRRFYTSRVTGTSQVWRQDGPGKEAIQLTGGEDATAVIAIAPDDSYVVVSRDVGGEENPGLYMLSPIGGPLHVIQHVPKVQTELQFIADDSKSLYFRANDRDPSSYAIYRYDIATGNRELVFGEPGLWFVADERKGEWLLVKELGNAQNEIYRYEPATKHLEPLLGQNEHDEYDVRFGAKPGQVLVRTNKLGDFRRVYSLERGALTPITPDIKHDVAGIAIDEARRRIYYCVDDDGYRRTYVLDAHTLKPLALPKLPDADDTQVADLSRNGRFVELIYNSSTRPSTSVTYDWQTGRLQTWSQPSTPEIDPSTFAKASLESYPARDGTKIPMFVWRPASCAAQPCPVIVEFHGGPEGQVIAGFSASAQIYVDAGFTLVRPNVRGSDGYGKAWLHSDDGPKRLNVITDIADCATYIKTMWAVNGRPPKVGVMGGSYGGYSTLMAMTYFAGSYDAGAEQVGMSNLVTFLENTAPYRRALRISEYGDPVKDRAALEQLSPINYVSKVSAPLLMIAGVNDPRVPVGEAIQIHDALARRGIPGGLILFADEGHGARKRGNIVLTIGHELAFFEKYLAPSP